MLPLSRVDTDHLDTAYRRLRNSWEEEGEVTLAGRRESFKALRATLVAHAHEFASTLNTDFRGRSQHESLLTEVALILAAIDYAAGRMARWARTRRTFLEWPHWLASAHIEKRARGVAGIIGPSNYPLQLALMPLISSLSAGCRTLIKPSEGAPATANLLQSIIAEAIDPVIATVVCGGPATAAALAALPLDILLFSGSNRVGRKVAAAAAANLTPTILELGGKSPVIVDRGADLTSAAQSIMRGKLVNAGQTCVAPDYVLVHAEDLELLVFSLRSAANTLYPDPSSSDWTAITSDAEYDRLTDLEASHRALPLFSTVLGRPFYNPKLIVAPPLDSRIMQQEIFGPLLPIIPYRTIDEAVRIVNGMPPALVLYWFGESNDHLKRLLNRTTSAAVSLNETVIHAAISALPLGGIGNSGWGRYHGRAGFDAFSHERPVFRQSRFNLTNLMRPPYGNLADSILRRLLR